MRLSSRPWRKARLVFPAIGVAVALVVATSPAWAVSGSGSYSGATTQTNKKKSPGCFETTGTFTSTSGTGTFGTYSGAIAVTFGYDFYQNSTGSTTYGDNSCTTPGSGNVTGASVTGGSGTLKCTWGASTNTFTRSGTSLTVVFPSSAGGCSINGGTNSPTTVTSDGTFSNCSFGPAPGPPTGCDESYTYTAS